MAETVPEPIGDALPELTEDSQTKSRTGKAKKMKVTDVKDKIWNQCISPDSNSLSAIYSKIKAIEPDTQGLNIKSVFLILLHLANEKGLTLQSTDNDIVIKAKK